MPVEKAKEAKKRDAIADGKPKPPKEKDESVGLAMRNALNKAELKEEKRDEEMTPLEGRLNGLSKFVRRQHAEEKAAVGRRYEQKRKLLGDKYSVRSLNELRKDELAQLDELYSRLAEDPAKMEMYLVNECIPALEKEMVEKKRKAGNLQEDMALARLDVAQLRVARELNELSNRLGCVLCYEYISPAVLWEARHPLINAEGARLRGEPEVREMRDQLIELRDARTMKEREQIIAKLEKVVEFFREIASSPSKAQEYLDYEKKAIPQRKKSGMEPDGEVKFSMIDDDLRKSALYKAEAALADGCYRAGVRCRFKLGSFDAVSDATGSRIASLANKDGTVVSFRENGDMHVFDAQGRGAICRGKRILQRRDREGNLVEYCADADAKFRVMDKDGYMLIMHPTDELRNKIISPEGTEVLFGEEYGKRLEGFRRIIASLEAAELRGILARAKAELPKAEKELGELQKGYSRRLRKEPDEAACIKSLSQRLRKNGILEFKGEPNENGFSAMLKIYNKKIAATVLPKATLDMLKAAAKQNHPANAFPNPETTLIVEIPGTVYPSDGAKEHPMGYVRQFTQKLDDGAYVTVLALHSELINAIRNREFKALGEIVYADVYRELKEKKYTAARFKLAWMPNSAVCQYVDERYGVKFREAMGQEDYNFLGAQQAFDNLVSNVTLTLTRPIVRAHTDQTLDALGITAAERKRANEYAAIMLEKAKAGGGDRYPAVRDAVLQMHKEAYGIDPAEDLGALDASINELRQKFRANPNKDTYSPYHTLDCYRDVADPERERQLKVVNEFERKARRANLGRYRKIQGEEAEKYLAECRNSFAKIMEEDLIKKRGKAVEKGLSIAMRRSRYGSRTTPTAFTISNHLQDITREIERENQTFGQEALFNELRNEVTPWDLVRRANQLWDVSHRYEEWSLISARAKTQRLKDIKELVEEFFDNLERGIGLGKAVSGTG